MNIAYLLIGGNLGNRSANLQKAIQMIEQNCGQVVQSSAIYETEAWGLTDQPAFYNQALKIETDYPPERLMHLLLQIEQEMGRTRHIKLGPRTIDLDMLFYDQIILNTAFLVLPHPAIVERRFVLLPLSEIAPNFNHPILHNSIQQLLIACTDPLDVQKLSIEG
jgi:2-amino-4-hydroxy-6-hydroxymethyldihydropteridine diphosphokinase